MRKTISIIVSGKVQGVFYRKATKDKAISEGIVGKVINLRDGTVSIVATGTEEQLQELISWCYTGPPDAKVVSVMVTSAPLQNFPSFRILRR